MKIKILIIDDESLARDRLRRLLSHHPEVEIIGECGDGETAVRDIVGKRPDLVFLDVQMPELDGFAVLESLPPEAVPSVVFVTAHDRFALKAFEVHAVDYLLKPFDRDRFETALRRAIDKVRAGAPSVPAEKMETLAAEARDPKKPLDRLVVKSGGRVLFVRVEEIDWIEAADNYIELHAGEATHLIRETMNSMEAKLPPELFMRISRSQIVNLERVKELQPMFHGDYVVILLSGVRLTLSRTHKDKLQRLMGRVG